MAMSTNHTWVEIAKKIENLTCKPENFLKPQNAIAGDIKKLIKSFYDSVKKVEEVKPKDALPELIIENFDDEQIWQELELQNNEKFEMFVPQVAKLMAAKNKLLFPLRKDNLESDSISENDDSQNSGSDDSEQLAPSKTIQKKKKRIKQKARDTKPSIVDDKFFKLRDMEVFLEQEERNGEKEDDSDEESIDMFDDEPSSDDDEAEDPDTEEAESFGVHYKDFFDPVEGQEGSEEGSEASSGEESELEENIEKEEEENEEGEDLEDQDNEKKKVRFKMDSSDDSEESEGAEDKEGPKSSFETRQERLKQKIERIHEEALGEKPWQLQGEVTATTRPQNSLLEEVLEFDTTSRPAPVITEETTLKLEDIIRQRIKDKVWDDVERKVKPVDTPAEYKKTLVLDQEKSKLSLSQIYEQDYLKKQKTMETTTADDEDDKQNVETPEQIEIKKMMHSLFSKLDAVSNYHYTPKTPGPEVKVISNLPAISVEEVAPVATSDATLLAPEEVKAKPRGVLLSKEERSDTDKKRERRKKKRNQKRRKMAREQRERKELEKQKQNNEPGKKMSKEQAAKHVEKATKQGTIKKLEDSGGSNKAVKSSTAFFSQLQDEVTSLIKNKTQGGKRKSSKDNILNIKKFKL